MTMHEKHQEWLKGRGLDPQFAEKFGLETVIRGGKAWLTVPYVQGVETVNHKYRLTSEKDHRMDDGAPLLLWNANALTDPKVTGGQAPLVITEGEWDALAVIQSGCPFAVSVPNGAPSRVTADLDSAKRYEWVDRHASELSGVKEFVIAADEDEAGHNLRTDLIALLGAERCRFVEYPFPCKDLNEVLIEYGPDKVAECIFTARAVPVQGLFSLADFPEQGEVRSFPIGIPAIAEHIAIVPGALTVVTGYANMGKSTMMNAIIGRALEHFPVCVASFETDVKPILRDGLRMAMLECGKHELHNHPHVAQVDAILAARLTIIAQSVDEDREMDLDHFLSLARIAVTRHGAKMIVLDPWNEIEHKRRRDESETEYIARALRQIKRFARQYDVAFWVVAHPSKPIPGVKAGPPGLYDISGSAHWANKPEYGLTYHRKNFERNEAEIIVTKVRMGLPGRKGAVPVVFDFRTSTFTEAA